MSISLGKNQNLFSCLTSRMKKVFPAFGEPQPTEQFAQPILQDNNEYLPTVDSLLQVQIPQIGASPSGIVYTPIATPAIYAVAPNGLLGTTRFFISDSYYRIGAIRVIFATAGTVNATLTVTKDNVVTNPAPGTGASLLTAPVSLTGAPDTLIIAPTITPGSSALFLAPGDSLSVLFAGTLTTLAGVSVVVELINTCSAYLGGNPLTQPLLQSPIGKTVPSNIAQFYVRANSEVQTQSFYLANRDMTIAAIYATIDTAFGAAQTIDITKETGTQAPGAGLSVLTAPMDATKSGQLLVPGLSLTTNRLNLLAGNRLAVKYSSTVTGAGVCITVVFAPIYDRLEISLPLGLFSGADAVAQWFFIASRFFTVIDASCVFPAAAGAASKIAVTIDKQLGAPGTGNVIQTDNASAGFDMNATANTVQVATLATLRNRLLTSGDRLGISPSAAAPGANALITVSLKPWS
jgi:hypothetical protein